MAKKRRKAAKRSVLSTKKGKVVGFTKVGTKLALVFRKKGKLVVGKSRFKNRTTLKSRLKKMIK